MKTFHPHQVENVYTHNNGTLSDEFIEIMKSNDFYAEHIRWNIPRFRPSEMATNEQNSEKQAQLTLAEISSPLGCDRRICEDALEETSQQRPCIDVDTAKTQKPMSLRSKRKVQETGTINEHQTHTQTRRLKRN